MFGCFDVDCLAWWVGFDCLLVSLFWRFDCLLDVM